MEKLSKRKAQTSSTSFPLMAAMDGAGILSLKSDPTRVPLAAATQMGLAQTDLRSIHSVVVLGGAIFSLL